MSQQHRYLNPQMAANRDLASVRIEWWRNLRQDVRYALRTLTRQPAFAAVVLLTLALGVGANVAIFSVVDAVLIRSLPYPRAEQLVDFSHAPPEWLMSQGEYLDYSRQMRTLSGLAAFHADVGTLRGETPERVRRVDVTPNFFAVLGVAPLLGRTFTPDEDRGRPTTVVVLSHALWQRRFGGNPHVVGTTMDLDGTPRTVIGVMPARVEYPEAGTDLWLPLPRFNVDSLWNRRWRYLSAVGRLAPNETLERSLMEARTLAARFMAAYVGDYDPARPLIPRLVPIQEKLVGTARPYLFALLGAVTFVLLIACVNVANLLLARGEGRRKELALRAALGASRGRILLQLVTESLVLGLGGGALGLVVAWAGDRALLAAAPSSVPRLDEVGVSWGVVAFALGLATFTGIAFGIAPAWRGARAGPAHALKEGGRVAGHRLGAGAARRGLVVAELALAVITLSGAGMLLRSLWHLQGANMGFDSRQVLTAEVSLPSNYGDARTALFFDQLVGKVRSLPGVTAAGMAGWLPVAGRGGLWSLEPEGQADAPARWPSAVPQQVSPGWLDAMRIPIVAGRGISSGDVTNAPLVAVVSRSLGRKLWQNDQPVGRRFKLYPNGPWIAVVGVAGDIRSRGFDDTPEPTMYFAYPQTARLAYQRSTMSLTVRVAGDPMGLANAVRATVRALDANVPVSETRTLEQVVGTSVANRRFTTALLAAFALLAVSLAGIGIYGVVSYGVTQRRFEIGVRMALGAERERVVALVLGEGSRMVAVGLLLGWAGAVVTARAIASLLVGVSTVDVPTMVGVAVLLVGVALVACLVPARRATRVDPVSALRAE